MSKKKLQEAFAENDIDAIIIAHRIGELTVYCYEDDVKTAFELMRELTPQYIIHRVKLVSSISSSGLSIAETCDAGKIDEPTLEHQRIRGLEDQVAELNHRVMLLESEKELEAENAENFTEQNQDIIEEVEYNFTSSLLRVKFKDKNFSYIYRKVPADIAIGFHNAVSKIGYFAHHIRDKFDFAKVDE